MGKCYRCNIDVVGDKFCPLCGKRVNEEENRNYPTIFKRKINKLYVLRVVFGLLILLNVLGMAVELMITEKIYYSWHMVVPSMLLLISIYFPLKKNWSFFAACCICIFTISGYIMFLENFTKTAGWGFNYVVPLFLLAIETTALIFLAISKFEKVEVFLPVLFCTILSLIIFLVVYLKRVIYWPAAVALLFGFAIMFTIIVVKYRRTKKSFHKSFHV